MTGSRTRFSNRWLLVLLGLCGALVLAGCGGSEPADSGRATTDEAEDAWLFVLQGGGGGGGGGAGGTKGGGGVGAPGCAWVFYRKKL